jgi:hypothetical protein
MSLTTIESVEQIVSENLNKPTIQSLIYQVGQSEEQFTTKLAANHIMIQEYKLNLQMNDIFRIQRSFPI